MQFPLRIVMRYPRNLVDGKTLKEARNYYFAIGWAIASDSTDRDRGTIYAIAAVLNRTELVFIGIAAGPISRHVKFKTRWIFHDPGRRECKSVRDVNEIPQRRLRVYRSWGKCNRSVSTLTGLGLFLPFFSRIFCTQSYFLWFLLGPHFSRFAWVPHFVTRPLGYGHPRNILSLLNVFA